MNRTAFQFTTVAASLLIGCSAADQYASRWAAVAVGDSRESVQRTLGTPTAFQVIELPLIKVEQATWKALSGRTYQVHFLLDHAVAKAVID
jgi:hypothetical protein